MCGMSLGVALTRGGIACEIVEIRPQLTEPGTGISLQGPALRALQSVGVLDDCISRGFGYSHFKACDAAGNVTGTVDLPRLLGADYPATIGVLRQSVHEVLGSELARLGVPIRLATTVKTLRQDERGVTAEFTKGEPARYDLVVGADGMNSLIRELAFGAQQRPHYTGQMVWRATVSRPPDVVCRHSYSGRPTNPASIRSPRTRCTSTACRTCRSGRTGAMPSCRAFCAGSLPSSAARSAAPVTKSSARSRSPAGPCFLRSCRRLGIPVALS
jgi:2-polyprenyl-6-methoxyphenol hydroxylase-like FAD-dependent oxidoreductase